MQLSHLPSIIKLMCFFVFEAVVLLIGILIALTMYGLLGTTHCFCHKAITYFLLPGWILTAFVVWLAHKGHF